MTDLEEIQRYGRLVKGIDAYASADGRMKLVLERELSALVNINLVGTPGTVVLDQLVSRAAYEWQGRNGPNIQKKVKDNEGNILRGYESRINKELEGQDMVGASIVIRNVLKTLKPEEVEALESMSSEQGRLLAFRELRKEHPWLTESLYNSIDPNMGKSIALRVIAKKYLIEKGEDEKVTYRLNINELKKNLNDEGYVNIALMLGQ